MVRYSNEEMFKVGAVVTRRHVKRRLINEKLIPYICSDCGMIDEWNDKKLVLQLEHRNGISNDNRLENLAFLCPNCHSQTPTYAGRNSKGMRTALNPEPTYRQKKAIADKKLCDELKSDETIRFGEWGWKNRFAQKVGITSQKVSKWLTRVDPDFLLTIGL